MKKQEEEPMFDFEGSQVDKFNDNHIDSGQMVKDKNSRFNEIKGNTRGSGIKGIKGIKSKLWEELSKTPIKIIIGIAIGVIVLIIGKMLGL